MKKRLFVFVVALVAMFGCTLTASAAPKTMPDGTKFDAEYYANTYPDVKQALGTSEEALYNHYVTYGRNEGRKPYDGAVVTAPAPASANADTKTLFGETRYRCYTTESGASIYDSTTELKWKDYIVNAINAAGVSDTMSDYDKCVAINNYICSVVSYGTMPIGTDAFQSELTDYCLVSGLAVCQGYADAFQSMCCACGIECYLVIGYYNNEYHVWNMVNIDGSNYYVDVVGNDSMPNYCLLTTTLPSVYTIREVRI